MADELQELIQKGLDAKKDWQVDTSGSEWKNPPAEVKTDNKAEPPTAEKLEDKKAEPAKAGEAEKVLSNNESSEQPKTEVKTEEVKTDAIPAKTFEELLAERTGGKIKDWAEIEAKLNEPKLEFANEQAQKINDFIKNGGKFDNDWIHFQSINFDEVQDMDVLIGEAMRLSEPGITDKEIAYRIKNDYKTDEWSEEENETTEIEEVMSEKMKRDALSARTKLKEHQQKTSFAIPQKSKEELQKEATLKEETQKGWEKEVDDGVTALEKVPVKIDEKESFDVIASKEEKEALAKMIKPMGTAGLNHILPKFLNEKGFIDMKKMQSYFFKAENFDNAVKTAYTQGLSKGASGVAKDIKNIKFNSDGKPIEAAPKTVEIQLAEQVRQKMLAGEL